MSTTVLDRPPAVVGEPTSPQPTTAPGAVISRPRLSEAMRKGAMHHPQGRRHLYHADQGTTCALGAVAVGLLGPGWTYSTPRKFATESLEDLVRERTGVDLDEEVMMRLPHEYVYGRMTLAQLIIKLNDGLYWRREQIADLLASMGY